MSTFAEFGDQPPSRLITEQYASYSSRLYSGLIFVAVVNGIVFACFLLCYCAKCVEDCRERKRQRARDLFSLHDDRADGCDGRTRPRLKGPFQFQLFFISPLKDMFKMATHRLQSSSQLSEEVSSQNPPSQVTSHFTLRHDQCDPLMCQNVQQHETHDMTSSDDCHVPITV